MINQPLINGKETIFRLSFYFCGMAVGYQIDPRNKDEGILSLCKHGSSIRRDWIAVLAGKPAQNVPCYCYLNDHSSYWSIEKPSGKKG